MPRISVVMIFLDAARFIADSIASVERQSAVDWELILVDDGSSDGSSAIAHRAAAASDGRIRYFDHPGHVNRGMAETRNRGMGEARGDYILYLDSDDILLPGALARLAAPLDADPTADLSCAATLFWNWDEAIAGDADKMQIFREWADRTVDGADFLAALIADEDLHPANCSTMVRRSAMLAVGGFDLAFRGMYEDTALLTALLLGHRVHVASACLSAYRMHMGSHCHTAITDGDYRADRPNAARDRYLDWAESYLERVDRKTPTLRAAIDQARGGPRDRSAGRRLLNAVRHPRKLLSRLRPRASSTAEALAALELFHHGRGDTAEAQRLALRKLALRD